MRGLTYIPADILRLRIDAAQNIAPPKSVLGKPFLGTVAHQWDVGGGLEHLIWPFLIFRLAPVGRGTELIFDPPWNYGKHSTIQVGLFTELHEWGPRMVRCIALTLRVPF